MACEAGGSRSTTDAKLCTELISHPNNPKTYNATLFIPGATETPVATLSYIGAQEEGTITLCASNTSFHISHFSGSGTWKLRSLSGWPHSSTGETLATASKRKFWRRNFAIDFLGKAFVLTPASAQHRDFEIRRVAPDAKINGRDVEGMLVGRLSAGPEESKSYQLVVEEGLQIELVVFCFWLVNLMNKRHDTASETALVWG